MQQSGVHAFTMRDIDERGMPSVIQQAIEIASSGTAGFHVSLDMDAVDPREAPGVGTPVRGGITYREAHLAMETLGDTGRMTSMEVVEVNPVIDEANRTAILAVELVHVGDGKEDSVVPMKKRVAVIYGGRSGEHEMSLRSAKSIIEAMDPEKYKVLHYLISKEGKWSPRPIVPEPQRQSGNRRRVSRRCTAPSARTARCRACWSWPTFPTSARAFWLRRSRWTRR